MTENMTVPGKRLGRKPASHTEALSFRDYLVASNKLTPIPGADNHLSAVPVWNMGGNNQFSTCGPTSAANFTTMTLRYLASQAVTVADDDIFTLYRYAGNPDFNPATGADDNGVDMNVLMTAWVEHGLSVTLASGAKELVTPLATAALNIQDIDGIRAATAVLGGVLFGFNMEVPQQTQKVWTPQPGAAEWGGHAVFGGAYTSVADNDEQIVSWAAKYGTSDSFILEQGEEVFVAILPQALKNPAFLANVNLTQFGHDWTDLTGKPFPTAA
jgi:hypothetical protein